MRIAIVTQPLMENYGGLLQNWALQRVLYREFPGAEVVTFDQVDWAAPWYLRAGHAVKSLFRKADIREETPFDLFRRRINATEKVRTIRGFRSLDRKYRPDVYIVGSDQVWRPGMVHLMDANFLGFAKCQRKVAYAASFGVDSWEFSDVQTARCGKLISDFSAVSVREADAVRLCDKHLGMKAIHVLDPTMLLSPGDYSEITTPLSDSQGYIFTYILDSSTIKRQAVVHICKEMGLGEKAAANDSDGNMVYPKLSVEEWLGSIRDSRLVVCDSFHGAAFSILFNRDFVVLENPQRGNNRITSLLDIFGLSGRLVASGEDAIALPPIDWDKVNRLKEQWVEKSLNFLHSSLK